MDSSSTSSSRGLLSLPLRRLAIFAIVCIVLDFGLGLALKTALYRTDSFWGANRAVRALRSETPGLIMGNSRAGLIDPVLLGNATGVEFYNATAPGQGIDYHIIILERLIASGRAPRTIVYEIDRHDLVEKVGDHVSRPVEMLSFLYNESPLAREILEHGEPLNRLRYASRLFQLNGTAGPILIDLFFRDRRNRVSRDDGFTARTGVVGQGDCGSAPETEGTGKDEATVSPYRIDLLERFAAMAREHGIKLYMTTSPLLMACNRDYSALFSTVETYADQNGVPYLNMLGGMQDRALFNDPNHLNVEGTRFYTQAIGEWMMGRAPADGEVKREIRGHSGGAVP